MVQLGNLLLLLLFVHINFLAWSENNTITDLKSELQKTKQVENQLTILENLCEEYLRDNQDSALHYSQKIIEIAQSNSLANKEIKGKILRLKAHHNKKQFNVVSKQANQLLINSDIKLSKIQTADCLYSLGTAYSALSKHDSCVRVLDQALELFNELNLKFNVAQVHKIKGLNYWNVGNYGQGLKETQRAIDLFSEINDSLNLSLVLNTKGAIHWGLCNYKLALQDFSDALYITEDLKDTAQLIKLYNNIGLVYHDWKYEDKAFDYYKKAEALLKKDTDSFGKTYTSLNLGTYYLKKKESKKALPLLKLAKQGYERDKDLNGVCLCQIRIAQCYNLNGKFDLARQTYFEAVDAAKATKNQHRIALAYHRLAENEYSCGEMENAYNFAQMSLEIAQKGNYKDVIYLVYERLSNIYAKQNKHKMAFDALKVSTELRKEIFERKIEVQYEINELLRKNERQEFENKQLKSENDLNDKIIRNQTYAGLVILILLLLVLSFYYRLSRKKKDLVQANKDKDRIFSIVSHDLRGPVGNLNNMVDFLLEHNVEPDKNLLEMFKPTLTNSYNLLNNLLVWAKSNLGHIEINRTRINVAEALQETLLPLNDIAMSKSISIKYNQHTEIVVYADLMTLQTIARNLVNNAIKFTNEFGQIQISVEKKSSKAIISIADNGVGINVEKQKTIFEGKKHSLGTRQETGTGLGLRLSKELATQNKGDLWFESTEGKGSIFSFSVPLAR